MPNSCWIRRPNAAAYPEAFIASPLSLVSLIQGLFDPLAGFAAVLICAQVYLQRKKLPFWLMCDSLAPLLATLGVAIGLSHMASGAAYGSPTNLPWAVYQWGVNRHPSQVYETLIAILIWAGVMLADRNQRWPAPGVLFLIFLTTSAVARLFLEAFRGDSQLQPGGLRAGQLIAWVVLAAGLWALSMRNEGVESPLEEPS